MSSGDGTGDLPTYGRHGMKRNCETSAYKGTYCTYEYGGKEPANSAYSSVTETKNGSNESPATRERTRSPPSPNGDYDGPSPCVAPHE